MFQSIIEDNEVHLLGWVLLVVQVKFLVAPGSNGLNAFTSFIDEWSFSNEFSILVEFIVLLEVSEEVLGQELFGIESERLHELFFSHSVKHVLEGLLVWVTDQFINECSFTFVSPKSNQEKLWSHLLLDSGAVLNDLVLWLLGNCADTLENSGEFTNSESVMELGWSWHELLLDHVPNADGSINKVWSHVDDFLRVLLWVEEYL